MYLVATTFKDKPPSAWIVRALFASFQFNFIVNSFFRSDNLDIRSEDHAANFYCSVYLGLQI